MLETFRKASKTWIVKLFFAVLTLSFVSWGVGDVWRSIGRNPAIHVGSTDISAQEVQSEFKREVDRLQPLFGGKLTPEEARKLGLMDRTIETIVTRTLIDEAGRTLGLSASDDAILAKVAANPAFRNDKGQFDRQLFRVALSRAGFSEESYLRTERSNMVRGQMAEALGGTVTAPKGLVEPLVRFREERRVAEVLTLKDDAQALPAAPDQATLEAWYKAHTDRFMAPELRAMTVLQLRPADVAHDIQVTPEMLQEAYDAKREEYTTPERRTVQQLVFDTDAQADKAAELAKQGKDLAAVAQATGLKVMDLGQVEKRDLPDELAEPVFSAAQGATVGPIKTPLGSHMVRVTQVAPGRTRPLPEVKAQLEQELTRDKANEKLSEAATKVEDALGGGSTVEEAASQLHLRVFKVAAMDAKGRAPNGKPVADLPKAPQFLDVAFHTEQGTESQLTEAGDEGYFLVRVDSVTPPQPKPFADVKAETLAGWQAEKRHEAALARADKAAEALKSGQSLAQVASAFGATAKTTKPFTREGEAEVPATAVAQLFRAQLGGVAVAPDNGGVQVARLTKVEAFDPAKGAEVVQANARKLSQSISGDLVDQYIAALNGSLGVKVDRPQIIHEE
jgi:peptidyl-prolyl cis-trans isomerase D